ncbi:MAG TPA: hypothetical protein VFH56_13905 [Acidimicrobiales bacterium]|nr:hypothetical protein [Acidimicrobiales bacterium]
MAKTIARDVSLKVNGVLLSDHVHKIAANFKWDRVEVSSMGAIYKQYLLGLSDASITVDFYNDYSAGSIHATLQPLAGSNTPFEVEVIPDSTLATSATNPRLVMWSVLDGYDFADATVGQALMMNGVTFYNAINTGPVFYTT